MAMPTRGAGLRAAIPALAALAALALAAPASATITTSNVTAPASPHFTYYDDDLPSADQTQFTVSGTSDGTTGDAVDIRCYYAGTSYNTLKPNVSVAADGSFTAKVSPLNDHFTCRIRAVPNGSAPGADQIRFAGPVAGFGQTSTSTSPGGRRYDFWIRASTLKTQNRYESAGLCGLYNYLLGPDFRSYYGAWDCVGALYAYDDALLRSQIQVDGHNAYTPKTADGINEGAEWLELGLERTYDPATGSWAITETSPLVYCADAAGVIVDVIGRLPATADCPKFVAAPVQFVRTITETNDGRVVRIADRWSSTDGAAHALKAFYDNYVADETSMLPGDSQYIEHAEGTIVDLSSSPTGTIYAQTDEGHVPGQDNRQGAMVYLNAPTRAVFSRDSEFMLEYGRTVPASGSADITHVYSSAFTREQVQALAGAVVDGNEAPVVGISSPADGAVVSNDTVVARGSAADNVGVKSLRVNGVPTVLQSDGSWSQSVALSPGPNTITAVATDASGNASQAQVTVIYSPAGATCTVPNVAGKPAAAAQDALRAAGCAPGALSAKPSSKVAKGNVISQGRAAGSSVVAFFPVDLVVSSGPVPRASLASKKLKVKKGRVAISVRCPKGGSPCKGTLKLAAKVGGRQRVIGSKAFRVKAGRKVTVASKLSGGVARQVRSARKVPGVVSIVYRDAEGKKKTSTVKVTITGG